VTETTSAHSRAIATGLTNWSTYISPTTPNTRLTWQQLARVLKIIICWSVICSGVIIIMTYNLVLYEIMKVLELSVK